MRIKDETYFELTSGRVFYAHGLILGIGPDNPADPYDEPQEGFSYGYDGGVDTNDWTKEEKLEVIDYMIALWQQRKDALA